MFGKIEQITLPVDKQSLRAILLILANAITRYLVPTSDPFGCNIFIRNCRVEILAQRRKTPNNHRLPHNIILHSVCGNIKDVLPETKIVLRQSVRFPPGSSVHIKSTGVSGTVYNYRIVSDTLDTGNLIKKLFSGYSHLQKLVRIEVVEYCIKVKQQVRVFYDNKITKIVKDKCEM